MYALKVLFTLSHIKQVDSRLLIQSTMELEEAFAFLKRPLLIGHIAYVSLHVRGTMTKYKIHDVILSAFFYIAEGAFAGIVKGV